MIERHLHFLRVEQPAATETVDEARDRLLAVARAHPDAVVARQQLAEMYETAYADPASALRVCREIQEVAPATAGVADCISRNQRRLAGLGQGSKGR